MLNNLVLMGRITKDPELSKIVTSDTSICSFDVAVENSRKDADGNRETSFFSVKCFNSLADNVVKHCHKGSKIAISGAIWQRKYLRKDGSKASTYEVIAEKIEFLDPKPVMTDKEGEEALSSLSGIPDEDGEVLKPAFDPYTGKPLKQEKK